MERQHPAGEGILEAARAIRYYLPTLVGPASAELDAEIARLLAEADRGSDAIEALQALLAIDAATCDFTNEVLKDAPLFRPPQAQPRFQEDRPRETPPLAGSQLPPPITPIPAEKYICSHPNHDYVWYRPDTGTAVKPRCPSHPEYSLIRAPES